MTLSRHLHGVDASRSDRLSRWAPLLLSSHPFPKHEALAAAPFDRARLPSRPWFSPASVPGQSETVTLEDLLAGMAGSREAAAPILEKIASSPGGEWIDFLAASQLRPASSPVSIGAFHVLVPLPGEQQALFVWYGQRLPQLENRCALMQEELERARRALAQLESGLRRERARVETLLEACTEPASIQDPAYRIVAQNGPHRRIFGDRRGDLCHEVYRRRELPCEGCPMAEALETRQPACLEDQPGEGPLSGLEVRIRALPLFAPDHSPGGIVEVFASSETRIALPDTDAHAPAQSLRDYQMQHIQEVLARCGGNRAEAARQLGISRATLWRRLGTHPTRPPEASRSA
ncbi:MAG: hypothetical protein O7F16_03220 [Acidobacteria bacterium]|nr:hypothetical protein [Acidobacteriota bacterium]